MSDDSEELQRKIRELEEQLAREHPSEPLPSEFTVIEGWAQKQ